MFIVEQTCQLLKSADFQATGISPDTYQNMVSFKWQRVSGLSWSEVYLIVIRIRIWIGSGLSMLTLLIWTHIPKSWSGIGLGVLWQIASLVPVLDAASKCIKITNPNPYEKCVKHVPIFHLNMNLQRQLPPENWILGNFIVCGRRLFRTR